MFGALTSLTGGGGLSGGAATNGDLKSHTTNTTEAGNVSNGGITIAPKGMKFDENNPLHLGAAALALVVVGGFAIKALKR